MVRKFRLPKRLYFALLYLSEGAPIGFLWWAMPTLLRSKGLDIESITLMISMLALPWAAKFVWAPVVDLKRSKRWGTRGWIVGTQLLMGLTLLPLLWIDWVSAFPLLVGLLAVHAFAAATQDVSIDALCIRSTSVEERGSINGWMQAGMLLGRSVFGGATLIVADLLGSDGMILLLVASIWAVSLVVLFSDAVGFAEGSVLPAPEYRRRIVEVFKQRRTWFGLLFALMGGAAFEAVGAVAGPFLIDRGFETASVGVFFAGPSVAAMMLGALAGGRMADKIVRTTAVRVSLLAVVGVVAALSLAAAVGETGGSFLTLALMTALYAAIGLFTASSYALFMDMSDRSLGAAQFSAFMAATNGCEAWAAFAVGRLIGPYGYAVAFLVLALVSLASLPLVSRIRANAV